jgi:uncharacterized membrane protein
MDHSLEERLLLNERLVASLLRERAGMASADDLALLHSAVAVSAAASPVEEEAPRIVPHLQEAAPRPDSVPPLPATVAWSPGEGYTAPIAPRAPRHRSAPAAEPSAAERWIAATMKATPGDWIARAGMALLLFGVAFLLKYSIDRGWVTPALRVGAGGAVGAALLVLGVRTHRGARPFSALFMGGGIGAWYMATFASYALYHLVPFPVAMTMMVATTLAAFGLALWSGVEVLAVVGALGGLGTPFVISTGSASAPGFVAYLSFILALTSGIYLTRRWRTTFAVGAVGTWMALATAQETLLRDSPAAARPALTVGYAAVLLAAWAVFLLPRAWPARFAADAEQAAHAWWSRRTGFSAERVAAAEAYLAATVPFFVVWSMLVGVWSLSTPDAGYLEAAFALAAAAVYAVVRLRHPALARAHAFSGALLGAAAIWALSRNAAEGVIAAAAYGTLLHAWAHRHALGRPLRLLAHGVLAVSALVILERAPFAPADVMMRLAVLTVAVCAYLVAAERVSGVRPQLRDAYRMGGHATAVLLVWVLCLPLLYFGGWLVVTLSAFAAGLVWLERRPEGAGVSGRSVDGVAAVGCQVLALFTVLAFCGDFGAGTYAWFNQRAAAEAALIASLALGAVLAGPGVRQSWLAGVGYGLWLLAAADQFDGLTGAAAFTTAAWAATGLALLLVALPRRMHTALRVAIATLGLVCAKLFLVDLANLDAIWRILLFIGVGAAFLAVSYYVRTAWLGEEPEAPAAAKVSLAE